MIESEAGRDDSADRRRRCVLNAAHAALCSHIAGPYGLCIGCLAEGSRPADAPCPIARWSLIMIETHGVADWDTQAGTQWVELGRVGSPTDPRPVDVWRRLFYLPRLQAIVVALYRHERGWWCEIVARRSPAQTRRHFLVGHDESPRHRHGSP